MARGRLTDASILAVREATKLEVVVSQYLTLKKAGGDSLKGLCPFHDEKSPSFNVNPTRQVFHCFGCQEGGDAISFIQKIEGLTFIETIERLAQAFNVHLEYEETTGPDRTEHRTQRARLIAANTAAAAYYATQLTTPDAEPARTFLTERGFDQTAATTFTCGYAPEGWDTLIKHLTQQGFTPDELTAAGLTSDGKTGPIDRFRGRLMFPIADLNGDIIGFGARKLRDNDQGPKYLNTPETSIYKKSKVLYGLNDARKDISRTRRVVVVEGYTDVMACRLSGETTAVATCGTAFGEEHIRILRRLLGDDTTGGEVIYTFDGDTAGQKAALRAFTLDSHFQTHTTVAVEPTGMDPCELRLQQGDSGITNLLSHRIPLFEFALKATLSEHTLTTPEGRANALTATVPIVAAIKHEQMRGDYVRRLAGWLGSDPAEIQQAVLRAATTPAASGPATTREDTNPTTTPTVDAPPGVEPDTDPYAPVPAGTLPAERNALKVILHDQRTTQLAMADVEAKDFAHPTYRALWTAITTAATSPDAAGDWTTAVLKHATSPTIKSLVRELTVEQVEPADTHRTPINAAGGIDHGYAALTFLTLARHGCTHRRDTMERMLANPDLPEDQLTRILNAIPAMQERERHTIERINGHVQ